MEYIYLIIIFKKNYLNNIYRNIYSFIIERNNK